MKRPRTSYLAVLGAAIACYAALGAVVRIVPQYVGGELGASAFAVGVAIGAPALTAVVARPLGGRAADRRGTREVVGAGAIVMAVSTSPLFIPSLLPFLLARVCVGIGEGAMMSATVLWLLRLAPADRRGRSLGHVGLANYAGLTLGPLIADALGGAAHAQRIFATAALLPLIPLAVIPFTDRGRVPSARERDTRESFRELFRLILEPGLGLLLVNVGYAALLTFGAQAVGGRALLVLPLYALTVIAARTLGGTLPDRLGGRRTLAFAAPTAAVGLLLVAFAPSSGAALVGVVVLGMGQGFAVPALGLLALEGVAAAQQGAAAGVFFAWFDAGVGIGGPLAGAAAGLGGAKAALAVAAALVAGATAVAGRRGRVEAAA